MTTLPASFNPSDYEFLIKSLMEGNLLTKAQSLKRFNTLIATDKKQFANYAKRIVVLIQQMLLEPKEDINLLASSLALQIINLNPRDIQYYVKTRLLKNLVKNLGDAKPQIRKTSHYCLLSYIKTYKSFDDLISNYIMEGIYSQSWQLKQKSINSFQSILIMEIKYLNWNSNQFKRVFELLIDKLNDQSPYVQKAAQQCLISLSKIDNIKTFSKRLSSQYFNLLKSFLELQKKNGTIQQIKLQIQVPKPKVMLQSIESKTLSSAGQSLLAFQKQKSDMQSYQSIPIPKAETPLLKRRNFHQQNITNSQVINKDENKIEKNFVYDFMKPKENVVQDESNPLTENLMNQPQRLQTLQQIFGKKNLDDLKNDKDWKIRSEALEEISRKFQELKQKPEMQGIMRSLLPILIKLLGDNNFKISITSLKMIEQILQNPAFSMDIYLSSFIEKLSDSKIAIRQNIAKIIKNQFSKTHKLAWIDHLLLALKKSINTNCKQEILNLLYKFYEDGEAVDYNLEKILNDICPMMQDLKTKIKIRTLDCLVMISLKSKNLEVAKSIIGANVNQVYYEMFIDKINKQLKTGKWNMEPIHFSNTQITKNAANKKNLTKNSSTTAASSKIHSSFAKENSITEIQLNQNSSQIQTTTNTQKKRKYSIGQDIQYKKAIYSTTPMSNLNQKILSVKNTVHSRQVRKTNDDSIFKRANESMDDDKSQKSSVGMVKAFRKKLVKNLDSKFTQYTAKQSLEPFESSEKQFKIIMEQLKSEDWQIAFESLNKLRRIIQNHSQLIVSPHIHTIVQDVLKLVESLRSSLSKNAMITMNELTNKVKRLLDPELDFIFGKLIKKTIDTNSFINEEVKKALLSLCLNSNQSKIINLLSNFHQTKSFQVKQSIIYILQNLIVIPKFLEKDNSQKIIIILANFLNQGSLQIRERTKKMILQLLQGNKSNEVIRLIPNQQLSKIRKKQLREQKQKQKIQQPVEIEIPKIQQITASQIIPKKNKNSKITQFPKEFENLEALLMKCESSDWKLRVEGMKQIGELCHNFSAEMAQYKLSNKVIDILSKQISDPNIKVATNALNIFLEVSVEIPVLIENNLSVVTNQLFNCFGSNKIDIRNQAETLFDSISVNIETWMLFQHLCNGAIYGIQKARPLIIQKLIEVSQKVYNKKPLIYTKNIYNTINKLLDQTKQDILSLIPRLVKSCQDLVGNQIFSNTKSKIKEFIN